MSPDDRIAAIGRMATEYRQRGNVSMIQLLKESGYLTDSGAITAQKLRDYFRTHLEDLDSWVLESYDNRSSPSWYIQEPDAPGTAGQWVVGFYPGDARDTFTDGAEACAIFVKRTLDLMASNVERAD